MCELVSVIVPIYKVERYLERCIQSISRQTYENLEIILVDDGSPDKCAEICDAWVCRDARIRVIHKENGGLSSARNAALDIAKGEFVCFVDGDDYIDEKLCEKTIYYAKQQDADIVIFNAVMITEDGMVQGVTDELEQGIFSSREIMFNLMEGKINHYVWNKLYRKRLLEDVRFPEGRLWEDMAITHKLVSSAKNVYCFPEGLYYYVQRPNSIARTLNEKALRDIFLARADCYYGIKDKYPEAEKNAFEKMAVSALRLYDRSLWAVVDQAVLEKATAFLQENRKRILKDCKDMGLQAYLVWPGFYAVWRKGKHLAGNLLKKLK